MWSDQDLIKEFATLGSVQKEKLPEYEYGQDIRFPPTAHDITKRKWRNAGPTSHHNSAAAMVFMLTDVGDDFHNAIHSTWGSLFTVGGIFHHRHKERHLRVVSWIPEMGSCGYETFRPRTGW